MKPLMMTKTSALLLRLLLLSVAATLLPSCLENSGGGVLVSASLVAPSSLSAHPVADGSAIDLTWTDNTSEESGFRIEVAPGPITTDSDVTDSATVPANSTTYTYPTQPNTTRYFRIVAVATGVQSVPSNVASATTPNVPLAPQRFDALVGPSGSDNAVSLLWDDTLNETSYTILRSANGGAWATLTSLGKNVTSFTDFSTSADGDYAYRIRANNANGSGAWSPAIRTQTKSANWAIYSSPPSGDISWFASLAVSPSGACTISSYDATSGAVALTSPSPSGTGLSTANLNPGFPASLGYTGTSIATFSSSLHVVANDVYSHELYYLTNETGVWVATPLGQTTDTDKAMIRVDDMGTVHVVHYTAAGDAGLRYLSRSGSTWSEELVSGDQTDDFTFAVDLSNVVHLAYRRATETGYELVYGTRSGGSLGFENIPTSGSPEMCSIAIGPSGAVYIAYNSFTTGGLYLLSNVGGGWTEEVVHQSPLARWGRYNSLAVDGNTGEIHISYQEALYTTLRYASRLPGESWKYQLVEGLGDVGRFSSIGLDFNGNVFIAYGDATNGRVKLARKLK
jgi:hypothetical protein